MDFSNNELFQMLLTDFITINSQIINDVGDYDNDESTYNNYINAGRFNNNVNYTIPNIFPVFPFYNSPSNNFSSILNESLYERNPIKHVVTEEVKTMLLPIKFNDAKDREKNEKCSITMEKFNDDDDIIQLPCNHCFCIEPIMQWLTEESCECPICRYKFDSMEKKQDVESYQIEGIENLPENVQEESTIIELNSSHTNTNDISRLIRAIFTDETVMNDSEIHLSSLYEDMDFD
jgi:hypothetical protein